MHLWQGASEGATLPWADFELAIDGSHAAEPVQIRDHETKAALQGLRYRLQVRPGFEQVDAVSQQGTGVAVEGC